MANLKYLAMLKKRRVAWNKWRRQNSQVRPDLRRANLIRANLSGADLSRADLTEANLTEADLSGANLHVTDLSMADLSLADLDMTNLRGAKLVGADLFGADLFGANLEGADFDAASLWATTFANVDLSTVRGLETVRHAGPSSIGIETVYQSKGIPEAFLVGAGVPDDFIVHMRSLEENREFYSCFISYSSKDQEFAERLYADLQSKGVRCWFAPEDLKTGDRFTERIEESIRRYDKLLLVLSKNAVNSRWVEREVRAAFEKEERPPKRTVLFPIRLDETVMRTPKAWAADIRRTRHIGEFSGRKIRDSYREAFGGLLQDLKAEEPIPKPYGTVRRAESSKRHHARS